MTISSNKGIALVLGLAIAAIAATSGMAGSGTSAIECGVTRSTQGNMLTLTGTLTSPASVSGEYHFTVQSRSGGGSSNISQGGEYIARANEPTTLGTISVSAGSRNDVEFSITANGKKVDCSQELVHQL